MKKLTIIVLSILFTFNGFAQKSKVLLTVGNEKVTADEFLHIYKKNNSDDMNKQSIDEYLELFKSFKLKVVEAKNLRMDTSKAFINELNGYRDQLAKPYLTENIKYDELIKEAYKRNQTEVKLDIIFVKLSKHAPPKDTLKAYNKALKIRQRILDGEDFDSVAVETSDDRMVKKNKGHLSFLPVLRIPYPIQSYAFSESKNELSKPIRTDYGYYLVRLVDTRPKQGFVKVAHIMVSSNDQMSKEEKKKKKEKVDSIYHRISEGDTFEDLLVFSDDKGTAKRGGELPEFSTGRMVPEFEAAAFALENPGDISKPVKTTFGWHIIKLIEKKPPKSKKEQREKIRQTIERDPERKLLIKEFVREKLKEELNFKELTGPELFYSIVDSTIYEGKWNSENTDFENKMLFSINDEEYNAKKFARYIEKNQKRKAKGKISEIVDRLYNDFVYESVTEEEMKLLEETNTEFKYIMREYHDGMLLFDLMKKEIWDKASEDSVGLKKYFEENKERYQNQTELDISVFSYEDEETRNETLRMLKEDREKYSDSLLTELLSDGKKNIFKVVESGIFSEGQSIYADKLLHVIKSDSYKPDQKIFEFEADKIIVYLNSKRKSKEKKFEEIKGLVIADYQNYLEKNWMEHLKEKYPITVNKRVLKKIKKSLD